MEMVDNEAELARTTSGLIGVHERSCKYDPQNAVYFTFLIQFCSVFIIFCLQRQIFYDTFWIQTIIAMADWSCRGNAPVFGKS